MMTDKRIKTDAHVNLDEDVVNTLKGKLRVNKIIIHIYIQSWMQNWFIFQILKCLNCQPSVAENASHTQRSDPTLKDTDETFKLFSFFFWFSHLQA